MKEGFNLTILSGQGWVSSNKHPQNTKCLNIPGTIYPNPIIRDGHWIFRTQNHEVKMRGPNRSGTDPSVRDMRL